MFTPRLFCVGLMLGLVYASCGDHPVAVEFYRVGGQQFSRSDRSVIEAIAETTAGEVKQKLPTLPAALTLRVEPGPEVNPDTGERAIPSLRASSTGRSIPPVGRASPASQRRACARRSSTTSYWLTRSAAALPGHSLQDEVVSAGLSTVFARDFAGETVPWQTNPTAVAAWVDEVLALPADAPRNVWMYRHPDGRQWIGPRVGTYLVDGAIRSSGRSVTDLVSASTDEIIALALDHKRMR